MLKFKTLWLLQSIAVEMQQQPSENPFSQNGFRGFFMLESHSGFLWNKIHLRL